DVAHLQTADLFLRQRRSKRDFPASALEAGLVRHRRHRPRRIAIEPLLDLAAPSVEDDAEAAEGPAVVGNRDEETRRQPVERADLAPDERRTPAEPHGADAKLVDLAHDRRLELPQPRIRVDVVERSEQLLFRVHVARRAVAADADADRAGRTPFAL